MLWKPDWDQARIHFEKWWNCQGPAFLVTAPRKEPVVPLEEPEPARDDLEYLWTDPAYRCDRAVFEMARHYWGGEAFPYFDTQIGPGSLGIMIGAEPHFAPGTVWYDPCITDPEVSGEIRFDENNRWFQAHMALIDEGVRRAEGRFLVGIPDLIENIDTLAAMRGNEEMLYDLIERPAWVRRKIDEINRAYFEVFDRMFEKVRDEHGGNAFSAFAIWGPGKTAKVQCDFSCMISPEMFREFVVPGLTEQCAWLDYSVYHLDGTTAVQHLPALLAIEPLNAIQWTPQAGKPGCDSSQWFDMYKEILAGGKGLHIWAGFDRVRPIVEELGPEGLYIRTSAPHVDAAMEMLEMLEAYR